MNRVLSLLLALSAFPSFAWSAPAPVSSTDRALHKGMMVLDTHLDTPAQFSRPGWDIMDRHDRRLDQSQVDYPRMIEGGLDGGFWSIYTSQGPLTPQGYATARDAALVRAVEIREMVARHHDRFALAFRAADAAPILAGGRKVVFQSIENSYPLGEDLGLLSTFHRLGVRMVGPVHFSNNQFADSATDPNGKRWNGLSPLGQALVKEANRLGMILDGSHASDDVLDQLIDLSEAPVILSHSGVKAVYDHPRNLPDALLRKLADKGGVIQINAYGPRDRLTAAQLAAYNRERVAIEDRFPVPRATFEDFMKHLLHALEVAGVDHVGVGADWDGGGGLIGFEDISALPQVTARLRQAGYGEADLRKIWGGNVLRLLGEVEVVAERLRSGAAQ
jgi:membrane dipeptidase